MHLPHISPLAGKPRTRVRENAAGAAGFHITPRVLTPFRAKAADNLHLWLCVLWLMFCAVACATNPKPLLWALGESAAMFVVAYFLLRIVIVWAFRAKTEIRLDADAVKVRRWLWWRSFERSQVCGFALLQHDAAEDERLQHEFEKQEAAQKGKVAKPTPYYLRSFHVVMVYAGQRVDLLSVYGQKEASAIVARLQLCNQKLDEAAGVRAGPRAGTDAAIDWRDSPGGVHRV